MPRHPREENLNNQLRLLRTTLGISGIAMTQEKLGETLGVSPATIKAIEGARRRGGELSSGIRTQAELELGARWNESAKEWRSVFGNNPYRREHYEAWRSAKFNQVEETHAVAAKLISLLLETPAHKFRALAGNLENCLSQCSHRFKVPVKDPDFEENFRLSMYPPKYSKDGAYTRVRSAFVKFDKSKIPHPKLFDFRYKLPKK